MAATSAPIAMTMATLSHVLVFPIWVALWGLALMPRSTLRHVLVITSIIAVFIAIRFLAPPPDERFFMLLVMLFGVIAQLDQSGRPNPFAVLGSYSRFMRDSPFFQSHAVCFDVDERWALSRPVCSAI